MLQLELNKLTEETNCMNARIEVENCMQELRSYLGIQEDLLIKVRIDNRVPDLHIDLDAALMLANENSPEIRTCYAARWKARVPCRAPRPMPD